MKSAPNCILIGCVCLNIQKEDLREPSKNRIFLKSLSLAKFMDGCERITNTDDSEPRTFRRPEKMQSRKTLLSWDFMKCRLLGNPVRKLPSQQPREIRQNMFGTKRT